MKSHYDYLVVGTGLFGSVFAREMMDQGKTCLMLERRSPLAGTYSEKEMELTFINMVPIFHTSNERVWSYINKFTTFNNYINSPIANYKGNTTIFLLI